MFVVDISPSMGKTRSVLVSSDPNGEERTVEMTNLEWALRYVKLKIQEMVGPHAPLHTIRIMNPRSSMAEKRTSVV